MISAAESGFINDSAYIPEHLVPYVTAVSGGEPYLFGSYLTYGTKGRLVFVGYPLGEPFDTEKMQSAFEEASKRLRPAEIALIWPGTELGKTGFIGDASDRYYRLDMDHLMIPPKRKNMVRRAAREIVIEKTRHFAGENEALVREFIGSRDVDDGTRSILDRIPAYIAAADTAWVINGRDKEGRLAAFDIVDIASKDYAFYMFNFRSKDIRLPGIADVLLHEIVNIARTEGKRYINLGLGINKGVSFFKVKWGGLPFLDYRYRLYRPKAGFLDRMLGALST